MKIIVEIDLPAFMTPEYVQEHRGDFFPTDDPNVIAVDKDTLVEDPTDDSFVVFRLVGPSYLRAGDS